MNEVYYEEKGIGKVWCTNFFSYKSQHISNKFKWKIILKPQI